MGAWVQTLKTIGRRPTCPHNMPMSEIITARLHTSKPPLACCNAPDTALPLPPKARRLQNTCRMQAHTRPRQRTNPIPHPRHLSGWIPRSSSPSACSSSAPASTVTPVVPSPISLSWLLQQQWLAGSGRLHELLAAAHPTLTRGLPCPSPAARRPLLLPAAPSLAVTPPLSCGSCASSSCCCCSCCQGPHVLLRSMSPAGNIPPGAAAGWPCRLPRLPPCEIFLRISTPLSLSQPTTHLDSSTSSLPIWFSTSIWSKMVAPSLAAA